MQRNKDEEFAERQGDSRSRAEPDTHRANSPPFEIGSVVQMELSWLPVSYCGLTVPSSSTGISLLHTERAIIFRVSQREAYFFAVA